MMRIARLGFAGFAALLAFGAIDVVAPSPASAQGRVQCDYGPSNYRRCCNESYRARPGLGARARADDIDACMDGRPQRQPDRGDQPPAAQRIPAPIAAPAMSSIRRIECSGTICQDGCAPGEIAISAFCKVGGFPATDGEQKAYCATAEGSEWPTVLICARK
jgi:hypothetical protein